MLTSNSGGSRDTGGNLRHSRREDRASRRAEIFPSICLNRPVVLIELDDARSLFNALIRTFFACVQNSRALSE